MKPFRLQHCTKALSTRGSVPLDKHLQAYFKDNRSIGSKDRTEIQDTILGVTRWRLYIDDVRLCAGKGREPSWDDRVLSYWEWKETGQVVEPNAADHLKVSHPLSLWNALVASHGKEKAFVIARANNTQAPFTLRANLLKSTRDLAIASLNGRGIPVDVCEYPTAFNIVKRVAIERDPAYLRGEVEVQDEASQIVAGLVRPEKDSVVIDWCAGSGGKALAIAAAMQGRGKIMLHDIRKPALRRAQQRLERAGVGNCKLLKYGASTTASLRGKADWLLIDAPCTSTGTIRRQPEQRYSFTPEDFVMQQREIVMSALPLLRTGGRLVYSTCSILNEENVQQVAHFITEHNMELQGTMFGSVPSEGGMDGMFGAVLRRKKNAA